MAFKHISIDDFKTLSREKSITLIDIRDPQSFAAGHIEDAIHISDQNVADFIAQADLDKPLVVCCYHGNSSQGAADYFHHQGFEETYSLDGGYTDWALQIS